MIYIYILYNIIYNKIIYIYIAPGNQKWQRRILPFIDTATFPWKSPFSSFAFPSTIGEI